jgi:hypothetical protein
MGAVSGCVTMPISGNPDDSLAFGATVTVVDRGWHTDLAFPAQAVAGPVPALGRVFPGADFLVFGFGDSAYYRSHEETVLGMLAALFPGPGVILVTGLLAPPADAFGADHVVTLRLSPAQIGEMSAFIQRALQLPSDGTVQWLGDGPYPGSGFYATNENYDAFHNCNHWTLTVLRSGGLPVIPDGVMFAGQVMAQARHVAEGQRLRPSPDAISFSKAPIQ